MPTRPWPRSRVARCGIGLAIGALAAGATVLSGEALGAPFLIAYPAVVLAAWLAGWEAAAMVFVVVVLTLPYAVLPPVNSFRIEATRDAIELATFGALSALIVVLLTRMGRALDCAAEATATREAMVAIVAHDLRNPLETIGLNAELLSTTIGPDREDLRTRVARIARAAERAHRLVEGNLDRAHGGDLFPLHESDFPLGQLIDEVISSFDIVADRAAVRLESPSSIALAGTVFCDRDRLTQALTNVVANAVAFTPPGGHVSLRVAREPNGVRFEITDSGPGMTDAELAHAFDQGWTGRPGAGKGLGLWVAKAIIDAHGGTISAHSSPGKGSTFSLFLPQAAATTTAVAAPGRPVPA